MYFSNKKVRSNIFLKLNILLTIFYLMWTLTPYLSRNISNNIILALILLWVFSSLMSSRISNLKINLLHILIIFWSVILTIYFIFENGNASEGNLYTNILYYFPVFIFSFYSSITKKNYLKLFLFICVILVVITSMSNIVILLGNPYASKYLTGSIESIVLEYKQTNLATVSNIMPVVLLIPIMIGMIQNENNRNLKYIISLSIIITIIYIVKAASSISLLILIIEMIMLVLINKKKTLINILFLLSIIIIVLIVFMFQDSIGNLLIRLSYNIRNELYTSRMQEIAYFIMGKDVNGSLLARLQDTLISLNTFLQNPIFGVGMIYSLDIQNTGIGMHSQIIDDMGRYGIFGVAINVGIYYLYIHNMLSEVNDIRVKKILKIIVFAALLLSLFNLTISTSFGLVLFLILPIYSKLYGYKEISGVKKHENTIYS